MKLDSVNSSCFYPISPKKAKSHYNVSTILIIKDINWHGKIISIHLDKDSNFSQNAQDKFLENQAYDTSDFNEVIKM
jgi:uncharacterized membrane protein